MLHGAIQLLMLGRKMHRRGTDILPDGHELMHDSSHTLLPAHHLTQLPTRHRTLAHHATTHAPHHIALHRKAFAPGLQNKHRIDDRPDHTVPTKTANKLPSVIP